MKQTNAGKKSHPRGTAEWSRIQKEAWARRRAREADETMATELSMDDAMDRLLDLEKRIELLKAQMDRMLITLSERSTFPPQLQYRPEVNGSDSALIDAALRVMEKIDKGGEIGFVEYASLKKGIRLAQLRPAGA